MDSRLEGLRDRTEGRTLAASSSGDPVLGWILVVGGIVAAWGASYLAGGSKTAAPHIFYVPVVVAAARFGSVGALMAAVAAGIAAGPLLDLDVAAGTTQEWENWGARLVAFVVIGQLVAYLSRHSLPSLALEVSARRFRSEVTSAIAARHVQVAYQPIVSLVDGSLVGAEALVRYHDPVRGVRNTGDLVCEAERAGCIQELTSFVLGEAAAQVAEWRRTVLAGRDQFKLAVNVSAADLAGQRIIGEVIGVLEETGLPSRWLHLEITETALVGDVESARHTIAELRRLGVRLAIDDFGTGESSLSYLDHFPVDVLKIDRAFVHRLSDHTADDALTHGIIAMAQAMHLLVVAEGVETETQAAAVRRFGCDYAQGFLFAPPMGGPQLEQLLASAEPFAIPVL